MIKKLRIKFVVISFLSIFTLLSIILLTVNITNFVKVAQDADEITLNIAQNEGEMNTNNSQNGVPSGTPPQNFDPASGERGTDRPEVMYDSRYFSITYGEDGTVMVVNLSHTASFTSETAQQLAQTVYSTSDSYGWSGNYRYRVYNTGNTVLVVFLDYSRELAPSRTVLYTSLIIGGVGLLLSFVAIYFISNLVVKPVDEALKKQKHFISNASHELKTPITIISANNEILEMEIGENESTDTINRQIRKLSTIVKDLNSLAKLDELDHVSTFNKFNLSKVVEEVIDPFYELFNEKHIKFESVIEPEVYYKGEESMIKVLINTIIENALKYSQSNALLTLSQDKDRVVIECKNDANSIKDGDLDEVFERFYRSDEVRSSIEGSGIGLSIAKEIIEMHKARIKARGEEGNFIIRIEL
ncbi:MAG: HAMP domain-containing histidine kinase [Gammaproteobacteria bacterium]|nr:HAMP domain-containing histidine kinase [Gammaproteobacteria bacterium]